MHLKSAAEVHGTGTALRGALAALALCVALLVATGPMAATPSLLVDVPVPTDAEFLRLSSAGFDVAGLNRSTGMAGVVVRGEDLDRLRALGFTYTLVDVSHPLRRPGEALSDYTDPRELAAFIDQTQTAYPNLVRKVVLRDTLFEGQKLLAVEITADVNGAHDRPVFLLDAQHHAREVMTAEIAKDAIGYLTGNYGKDAQVTQWLDHIEVWVVACVNPDGAMYVFDSDNMWRKNRNPVCAVDINRNYGWNWDACNGSDGICYSETYRGAGPESEPETQGMVAFEDAVRPLFSLSYHSYGEYLLYPFGCNDPDEMAVYGDVAQTLNGILENDDGVTGKYKTGPGWSTIYRTDGSSDDTGYGRYGASCYVIEVNASSFQPDYAQWRDITVQRQRTAWQYFLDKTLTYPSIQGRITDAATGAPLEANLAVAEVALTRGETPRRASATGRYGWVLQGNRTYHVTFSMPGYMSDTREIAVGTAPAKLDVQLLSTSQAAVPRDPQPADKSMDQGLTQVLSWTSDGADGFEVYMGTTSAPPMVATTTAPTYTPPALELGKTYTWQVVALVPGGKTPGPAWSFSTRPCAITAARKASSPIRLIVDGIGFAEGDAVYINGAAAPMTVLKSATRLVAKGTGIKAMLPKGTTAQVTVKRASGGSSEPFTLHL